MRNRLVPCLTALLAVALVVTPASANPGKVSRASVAAPASAVVKPATTRKIALGVSMLPFADSTLYDQFKQATGKAPALWSVWSDWGGGANPAAFPTALVNRLRTNGTVPLVFWQPTGPGTPPTHPSDPPLLATCGVDYSKITSGQWDTYIRTWATAAKGKGRILVRFALEMDGGWFPYGVTRCNNTPAKFVKMWKHVVTIFRQVGATNVKFVWSPLRGNAKEKSLYPGNSWVNYVGVTAFNWASWKNRKWESLTALIKESTKGLTAYSSRPWIVAETASITQSGKSRPSWVKGWAGVYTALPKVAAIMYFNIDMRHLAHNQPNWQLNTTPDINAYKYLLNNPRFQGKIS